MSFLKRMLYGLPLGFCSFDVEYVEPVVYVVLTDTEALSATTVSVTGSAYTAVLITKAASRDLVKFNFMLSSG